MNYYNISESRTVSKSAVSCDNGIVSSQHIVASMIGGHILSKGGSSVDAICATAIALSFVEPWMAGIGANGFLLHKTKEECDFFNFSGVTPATLPIKDFHVKKGLKKTLMRNDVAQDNKNIIGVSSACVPGLIKVAIDSRKKYGILTDEELLEPIIRMASTGVVIDSYYMTNYSLSYNDLSNYRSNHKTLFNNKIPVPGDQNIYNKPLISTLKYMQQHGLNSFYNGCLAEKITQEIKKKGGYLRLEDFQNYSCINYNIQPIFNDSNLTVYSTDNFGGGEYLGQLLKHSVINNNEINYHKMVSALKKMRLQQGLIKANNINNTSHISVIDKHGNTSSMTLTLLNRFGCKEALSNTGILLNNALGYFSLDPMSKNSLEPSKRVQQSNMCPTIAIKNQEEILAIGASGSYHIIPAIYQSLIYWSGLGKNLEEVFNTPRIELLSNSTGYASSKKLTKTLNDSISDMEFNYFPDVVTPKLYGCPIGATFNYKTNKYLGIGDIVNPCAQASCANEYSDLLPTKGINQSL